MVMLDIKMKLGKKIKTLRLNKGLTQAEVCDDQSELTIRQLVRIENGQVIPTIPKLMYLSNKLDIKIQDLVNIDQSEVPKRYLELKNKLIRYHTYGNEGRIFIQDQMFDEIYDRFYDDLPEEEQLLVELLQVQSNIFSSSNPGCGLGVIEKYLRQILKKDEYSYNDLLIINIYFLCCSLGLENKQYFNELSKKVLLGIDYSDLERLYLLECILLSILLQKNPKEYLTYTSLLRQIIEASGSYQHKPMVYAFEARYYIKVEHNKEYMSALYDKAISFAKMLNDDILVKKLEIEKESELAT